MLPDTPFNWNAGFSPLTVGCEVPHKNQRFCQSASNPSENSDGLGILTSGARVTLVGVAVSLGMNVLVTVMVGVVVAIGIGVVAREDGGIRVWVTIVVGSELGLGPDNSD